jgi:DNA-directed RNA polymerase specialized sigma24 family protein
MADVEGVLAGLTRDAGSRLVAYGFVLTGSQRAAEDLVCEAILKTFVRRPRLADLGVAERRVRLAMRTLAIDRARKARRWGERAAGLTGSVGAPASNRADVESALTSLTAQQRLALAMRYWDDLAVPEVASALRLKPGTVTGDLHAAARVLGPLLGEHTEIDDGADEDVRVVGVERTRRRRR